MRAQEFTRRPHLYLDMDGVQADFFTAWAGNALIGKYLSDRTGKDTEK